jgi:putative transposase
VLKARDLLAHRGRAQPPRNERPKALVATRPNQVWSWDITYLRSSVKGRYFYLYLVMDIYSRKILSWRVEKAQLCSRAAGLIEETCASEGVKQDELFIHSDNGGPMRGSTMLATLQRLGVIPSFSRPHVSNDNAFSEALFKTLKYSALYPGKPFENLEAARNWVDRFVAWYNHEHRHSQIAYVTPQARYLGKDTLILEKRAATYLEARKTHPERWGGHAIRKWEAKPFEILNPLPADRSECYQ